MNSYQRIRAMVNGEKVDRPAFTGWMHLPLVDRCIKDFVHMTISNQLENNWDVIKIMPNGLYFTEAFGQGITFSVMENEWRAKITRHVIEHPAQFAGLRPVSVQHEVFQRELDATKRIVDRFKGEVPVIATVFTPLTWASEMYCGFDRTTMMVAAMQYSGKALHEGLKAITETNINFCNELVKAGVDGIFYATHYCSSSLINREQHEEFGIPYDLQVLDEVNKGTWFNMLHLHASENIMVKEFAEYPVQAINWEDICCAPETRVTLKMARSYTSKILVGGLDQHHDLVRADNDREAVKGLIKERILEAVQQAGPDRLIFAPGCAFPNTIPRYRFHLISEAMEDCFGNECV